MSDRAHPLAPGPEETAIVEGQLGRPPRGTWRTVVTCVWGCPSVISVAPTLGDGSPFPTAFWLTCPWLVAAVGAAESRGAAAAWTERIAQAPELAADAVASDRLYRGRRRDLGGGIDPCAAVGVAGQDDPLAVKCLHARVASAIAGMGDPVGRGVLADLEGSPGGRDCPDDRCRGFAESGRAQ